MKGCFEKLSRQHAQAADNFQEIERMLTDKVGRQKQQLGELKEQQVKTDTHLKADQIVLAEVREELRKTKVELQLLGAKNEQLRFENATGAQEQARAEARAAQLDADLAQLKSTTTQLEQRLSQEKTAMQSAEALA